MLSTELPVYLYGVMESPYKGDGALFHYTSLGSLKKIMEDLTLKLSSFAGLNDMNEGNVYNMSLNRNFTVMRGAERLIKERCHIISFSQNYGTQDYGIEGTNHPAMWAHYADNSNGACIVIDKDAFIAKNEGILSQCFYQFEDVVYSPFNTPDYKDIDYEAKTPEEFIKNNWKSLFFLKHQDWANEDEHRLFIMDCDAKDYNGKLSIYGCIKYIVLGRKIFWDDTKIKEILDIVVNPESICYRRFLPHSFATTCYDIRGYRTFEIASRIEKIVRMNMSAPLYADYKRWIDCVVYK